MRQIYLTGKNVLKERNYFLTFVLIAVVFFGLFVYIPIATIPGNSLEFQLSIFSQKDYILMLLLAILVGLNFSLQIYSFNKQKEQYELVRSTGQVAVSGISGVFGSVVGTATCASCLAFFFGLIGLGTGSVLFVLKNQIYFLAGSIAVMLATLYFTVRKVNETCGSCGVKKIKR